VRRCRSSGAPPPDPIPSLRARRGRAAGYRLGAMTAPDLVSPRSRRVTAARRLAKRAFRERGRRFLAEGPQAVREAVSRPGTVVEVYVTSGSENGHRDILSAARRDGAEVIVVSGATMVHLAQTVTPQGLIAVCRFLDVGIDAIVGAAPRLVPVLTAVRDPGNAGTVIRAADAAGADAVVLTNSSVDPYNGKCVRASAGSIFHLPLVAGAPSTETVDRLRAGGLRILAADGRGERDLDDALDTGELDGPTAWLFGNEAWGLPDETVALADAVVRIPIYGRAESLNLGTAAAVCMYASARAHRRSGASTADQG
jgi:RNA methyltransferase, TrmH family